ncbi:threonine--tRNA ligase [Candidatus Kuenenbacteria bacterium]|nr:threonine--tRNA ligase [Candidatus Kuenenbacteria bacterium]
MSNKEHKNEKLWALRHSAEHVLTMAMYRLWGNKIKAAMGPATDEGFYFDFDSEIKISEDDFPKIEEEMAKIIKENLPITKEEMAVKEARKFFNNNIYKGNEYKHEWLDEIEERGEKVSVYWMGEKGKDIPETFVDICSGPHAKSTGEIKSFKLMKIAGAYWHGDEKNKMLTRIYGTAFEKENELAEYLHLLEEAEKRDHRKLGKEMGLFHVDEMVGLGLPLWHPKGALLWRIVEDFWYREHLKNGYELVRTPHIGNKALWETSGHWGFYNESMYSPIEAGQSLLESQNKEKIKEPETYLLKPMNCPFHVRIYKNNLHSYRELPFRWAECGTVYRFEKKGELSGLTRVRGFTQDDAHIICRADQVEDELKKVIDFILFIYKSFGFKIEDIHVYLSVRDPNNKKYAGTDEGWSFTEKVLEKVAKEKDLNYEKEVGGAVFYGPKLDFKIKDALGREWQCSTLQFDFNLPERFAMGFTNAKGEEETPYMLHRALFGSYERFIGLLIEHYAGAFPLWLSPVQVSIISVGEKHIKHCQELAREFAEENIRVEIDESNETVGNKIRRAVAQKIPYMLVIGDKEMGSKKLQVRKRGERETLEFSKEEFVAYIRKVVGDKTVEL